MDRELVYERGSVLDSTEAGHMRDEILPPGSFRGAPIPWWSKMAAKIVLSRLPVPHGLWSKLNIFRHSYGSGDPQALIDGVRARVERYVHARGQIPRTIVEFGPGEITTCAVVYRALGVERTIFVDVGDFGSTDVAAYQSLAEVAAKQHLDVPDLSNSRDRADAFLRCGAEYHTEGLASLRRLPAATADLVTSTAVIEHIRRSELAETFAQSRRILRPDGMAIHTVDFQDHLGGRLENLRFSSAVWESDWMSSSGFYTNRVSASGIVRLLEEAGFEVEVDSRSLWGEAPITLSQVNQDLRALWTDADLRTCGVKLTAQVGGVRGADRRTALEPTTTG